MEFFDWLSVPQFILEYFADWFNLTANTEVEAAFVMTKTMLICIAVAAGLYVIGLVFSGMGLSTMAKRAGVKHGFLGFIPFANTYLAGKLAGESSFFGKKIKNLGIGCTVLEALYFVMQAFVLITSVMFYSQPEFYVSDPQGWLFETGLAPNPAAQSLVHANFVVSYLAMPVWIAVVVIFWIMYLALFRKYYARNPMIMTFLCAILPFRGFVLFAVRNNTPVNYNEYLRQRAARQQQQYGNQGGYNGYGNNNGYGGYNGGYNGSGNQGGYGGNRGNDPFSEFGGGQSNGPFSEFGNSNPRGNGNTSSGNEPFSEFGAPSGGEDSPFSDFNGGNGQNKN